jgi:hypothetical protein
MEMKLAICICCFSDRPKYLYTALYSIFKMNQINKVDIYIFLGGTRNPEVYKVIGEFTVNSITFFPFIGDNFMCSSLRSLFNKDYETVILTTDDIIFRPDTIDYILSISNSTFIEFLYPYSIDYAGQVKCEVALTGYVFNKATFEFLDSCRSTGCIYNTQIPTINGPKTIWETGCKHYLDAFYSSMVHHWKALCRFPAIPYILHFGFQGITGTIDNYKELEDFVFSGDKNNWLSNILNLLHSNIYSGLDKVLFPTNFKYGD